MKVLCIGEALIDMICTDVNVSLSNGQHFLKKAGGAPANVAAAIAALGGKVTMAAKVGDDPFGQQLIELLENMGVDTSFMIKDPAHFTTFAFVSLMNDGERDFYFNRGADKELTTYDLAALNLKEYSIVHFGSATAFLPGPLQSTYLDLLAKAKQADCLISFDPNYRHLLFQNNSVYFTDYSTVILNLNSFSVLPRNRFVIFKFELPVFPPSKIRVITASSPPGYCALF
jgi:fructokinase